MGFNIYGSSLFTSLSNGIVSAFISFMRTIVFEIGCVYFLIIHFALLSAMRFMRAGMT